MLLSLSLLAVVGGALAFKTKTGAQICWAPVNPDNTCPQFSVAPKRISDAIPTGFICTCHTVPNGSPDICHTAPDQTVETNPASVFATIE